MKIDRNHRRGFTLVELLVVIAIIAILAALATPALLKYLKEAKIVKSTSVCRAFETAVDQFESEYNFLPYDYSQANAPTSDTEESSIDGVITVLTGLEDDVNTKKIKFFEPGEVNNQRDGVLISGNTAELYDPWGLAYRIIIDYDYDGEIEHPYDGDEAPEDVRTIRKKAICWSLGPDASEGNPSTKDNPSNFE